MYQFKSETIIFILFSYDLKKKISIYIYKYSLSNHNTVGIIEKTI